MSPEVSGDGTCGPQGGDLLGGEAPLREHLVGVVPGGRRRPIEGGRGAIEAWCGGGLGDARPWARQLMNGISFLTRRR